MGTLMEEKKKEANPSLALPRTRDIKVLKLTRTGCWDQPTQTLQNFQLINLRRVQLFLPFTNSIYILLSNTSTLQKSNRTFRWWWAEISNNNLCLFHLHFRLPLYVVQKKKKTIKTLFLSQISKLGMSSSASSSSSARKSIVQLNQGGQSKKTKKVNSFIYKR